MLCGATSLPAATATWKGGAPGTPDHWGIQQNWFSGTPPAGNDAVFGTSASFIGMMQSTDASVNTISVTTPGFGFNNSGIAGSTLTVAAGITVTFAGTGTTTFASPVKAGGSQTWAMDGSRGTILWNEPVDLNGKTVTLDGTGIQEFNGGISGAGNFIKSGTGRVRMNSAITGGGGINVLEGEVVFSHATNSKTVQMSAPGVVSGAGTVTSLSGSSGTVRPGLNAPGVLTVTGSLLLSSSAVMEVEINGPAAGSGHDQLSVGNSVSLGSSALSVTTGAGFSAAPGATFTILNNNGAGAVSGTFSGKPEGATFAVGNVTFRISYTGGDGNDVTLKVLSVAATGLERVWTGALNSLWSTPGNWSGGVVPQPGDNVQFPEVDAAKKSPQQNLGFGFPIHLVRFTAGGYTLGGDGLTLSDGIVQQAPAGAAENKVTLALASVVDPMLPALVTRVRLQSGGPLTVTPPSLLSLNQAASELRLQNDQAASVLTCGAGLVGTGFISSAGPGPVVLSVVSLHSGGVTAAGAQCIAAVSGALGSGPVTVTGGLSLGSAGGGALTHGNAMKLSGTVRTTPGSAAQTWSGPVELMFGVDSHLTTAGGALEISGVISGEGALFLSGNSPITFSGPASNTWNGITDATGILVQCQKPAGVIAIPGDFTISGNTAALSAPLAGQLASTATLSVLGRASASFGQSQTLAALELDSGTVSAPNGLAVTGNLTAAASLSPSEFSGKLYTGPGPVTWQISGPQSPGLRFSGRIGGFGGSPAIITKTGAGLLQVNDAPGSSHEDVSIALNAGGLEWNDAPDAPGDFGPVITMNGGALSGIGRVLAIHSIAGGQLNPGVGTGTLTSGQTELRENVTFLAEWTGTGDLLAVQGALTLNNATLFLSGTKPPYGTPWLLAENDGADAVNGQFAGLPEGGTLTTDGALLRISYTGGDGNDVVLTRIPPEAPLMSSFDISGAVPEAGGSVIAVGTGRPAFTYALEYSSDLTAWTTAASVTADGTGAFHFDWMPADFPPRRFFRISAH